MKYVFCAIAVLFVACDTYYAKSTFPWIPQPSFSDAGVDAKADAKLDAYSQDQ